MVVSTSYSHLGRLWRYYNFSNIIRVGVDMTGKDLKVGREQKVGLRRRPLPGLVCLSLTFL